MTDFRAFAADLAALCDERDSAEAALGSVQAQLDAANATIAEAEADLTTTQGELDVLRDQFAAYKASHPDAAPPPPPPPTASTLRLGVYGSPGLGGDGAV